MSLALIGCGSNEPTVIQPGPDYQLTPEEVRMKAEMDEAERRGYSG